MNLSNVVEIIPLETVDGQVRIKGSRIPLDTIVISFKEGVTAEEIVRRYPSLSLAEVYSIIGYYLNHQQEIEEYLEKQQEISLKIRNDNESRFNQEDIRERLLARKAQKEKKE